MKEIDLVDPDLFTWDWPVWAAFDLAKMSNSALHPIDAFAQGEGTYHDGQRHRFVAVFTDEDLARRFIEDFQLGPHHFEKLPRERFGGLMLGAQKQGIRYVAFDAHGTGGGKHFEIAQILRKI